MIQAFLKQRYATTLVANITVLGSQMLSSIILARWLGPAGRGEVAAALLWPTLLVSLGSLGIIQSCLYFAAQADVIPASVFANAMAIILGICTVVLPLGYFAMPLLLSSQPETVVQSSRVYLLVIPVALIVQSSMSLVRAKLKIVAYNLLWMIVPIGYLIGIVVIRVFSSIDTIRIVELHLFLNVATLFGVFFVLAHYQVHLGFELDTLLLKRMLRYGFQVHLGSLSATANLRLDQAIMAAWLPSAQLGLYLVGVSIANISGVFATTIQMVATPSIAGTPLVQRGLYLQSVLQKFWVTTIPIKLGMAIIAPWAIPLVYGPEFREAILVAEILLLASVFFDVNRVLIGGLQALERPWLGSRAEALAAIATVTLLVLLVPTLGIVGAAITSTMAYGIATVRMLYDLHNESTLSVKEVFRIDKGFKSIMQRTTGWYSSTKRL